MGGRKEVSGGPKISHRINNLFLQMLTLYLTKKKKTTKNLAGYTTKHHKAHPHAQDRPRRAVLQCNSPWSGPTHSRSDQGSRNPG